MYLEETVRSDEIGESVEALSGVIRELAEQRQALRASGADEPELERNRLALVESHRRLAHALIERHLRAGPFRPAA
jgi:hypothetical protein